jgi:hypothetical protein
MWGNTQSNTASYGKNKVRNALDHSPLTGLETSEQYAKKFQSKTLCALDSKEGIETHRFTETVIRNETNQIFRGG